MSAKEIYGFGKKYKSIMKCEEAHKRILSAKERFEDLGYEYNYDDGFIEYLKGDPIPDRLNTIYIKFKKIVFNKMDEKMSIYSYKKDALCQEIIKDENTIIIYLNKRELQAINKQVEELGWNNEN